MMTLLLLAQSWQYAVSVGSPHTAHCDLSKPLSPVLFVQRAVVVVERRTFRPIL